MRTPSGAIAEIVATYPHADEVLVRWPDGQEARFRPCVLRELPR